MDYGIQKERIYDLLPTQMQIGQVALIIDEAPVEQCSTWVSVSIMAKKETIISISIYSRGRVYCNNIILYIGSLDETNFDRYTG